MSGCCGCAPTAGSEIARGNTGDTFWIRLGVALVLAGQSMVLGLGINLSSPAYASSAYWWLHGALIASALIAIGLLGPRLARESWLALRAGRITVEALFVISCAGALCGSLLATFTGEGSVYYEVVAIVLVVYSVGKRIGASSRDRVLREIAAYRETFETAREILPSGEERIARVDRLHGGALVRIDPGEPVPVDGVIRRGTGYLEQSQLTGEPIPVIGRPGGRIHAGSWSVDGTFVVETTGEYGERTIDRILGWVEKARERPSRLQTWADRTIGWFFPVVLIVATLTFAGWFLAGSGWAAALFNSMAVLLVACPCALGLATPIAVWKGMFRLAERGFLCRHGEAFDALARSRRIFFDKTGTLSEARLIVRDFQLLPGCPVDPDDLRDRVAAVESGQEHPVARALARLVDEPVTRVAERTILPGRGIEAVVETEDGPSRIAVGPGSAPASESGDGSPAAPGTGADSGRTVTVSINGTPAAVVRVEEVLRGEAAECLRVLGEKGLAVEILSGDPDPTWPEISGVAIEGSLSPEAKRARVEASVGRGEEPLFVGDGINDSPAMAAGAASIAIGEGASLPRGTSDAVLLGNDLGTLAVAIDLARSVFRGVRGNLRFAVVYNLVGISLAAGGVLHPIVAALLMLASSATVSIRALRSAEPPPVS